MNTKKFLSLFLVLFFVLNTFISVRADTIECTVDRQKIKDLAYRYIPTKAYKQILEGTGQDDTPEFRKWVADKISSNGVLNFYDEKMTLTVDNFINTLTVSEVEALNSWDISKIVSNDGVLYYTEGQNSILDRYLYSLYNAMMGNRIYPSVPNNNDPFNSLGNQTIDSLLMTLYARGSGSGKYGGGTGDYRSVSNYQTSYNALSNILKDSSFYGISGKIVWSDGSWGSKNIISSVPIVLSGNYTYLASSNYYYQVNYNNWGDGLYYVAGGYAQGNTGDLLLYGSGYSNTVKFSFSSFSVSSVPSAPSIDIKVLNKKVDDILKLLMERPIVIDAPVSDPISVPVPEAIIAPVGQDVFPTGEKIEEIINNYYTYNTPIDITPPNTKVDMKDTNSILGAILKTLQDFHKSFKDFWKVDFNLVVKSSQLESILEEKFKIFYILSDALTTAKNLTIEENPPVITYKLPDNVMGGATYTVVDLTPYKKELDACKVFISFALWFAFGMGVWDYFNPKLVIS